MEAEAVAEDQGGREDTEEAATGEEEEVVGAAGKQRAYRILKSLSPRQQHEKGNVTACVWRFGSVIVFSYIRLWILGGAKLTGTESIYPFKSMYYTRPRSRSDTCTRLLHYFFSALLLL